MKKQKNVFLYLMFEWQRITSILDDQSLNEQRGRAAQQLCRETEEQPGGPAGIHGSSATTAIKQMASLEHQRRIIKGTFQIKAAEFVWRAEETFMPTFCDKDGIDLISF